MNLVLVKQSEQSPDGAIHLPSVDPRTMHITQHLRKRTGDTVAVGIVDACRCTAAVGLRADGSVSLTPRRDTVVPQPRDAPAITLLLAMPFPRRMKWLWPVLGSFAYATRVVVVRGELTDAAFCESTCLHPEVYVPLLEKGMAQGARTRSVAVDVRRDTVSPAMIEGLGFSDGHPKVLLDCGDDTHEPEPLYEAVSNITGAHPGHDAGGAGTRTAPALVLAIGPERGWTEHEAQVFRQCGFVSATLGASILRVDTAVVGALSVATAALDARRKRLQPREEEEGERHAKRAKIR